MSGWMEKNGYLTVNNEKMIFMKLQGLHSSVNLHCLFKFVDDVMHVQTCDKLKKEFMEKDPNDLNITGGGLMETF
jgi:hypothetical protein